MGNRSSTPVEPGTASIHVLWPHAGPFSLPIMGDHDAYPESLPGYIGEMEWHMVKSQLHQAVRGAGRGVPYVGLWFALALAGIVIGFFGGILMTTLGFATGADTVGYVGIGMCGVFVASLICFIILNAVLVPAAARRWCAAALHVADSQMLPELRARHPLMVFSLRDLRPTSFRVCVERQPEGRDSQGHIVVGALEVMGSAAAGGRLAEAVASAPPVSDVLSAAGGAAQTMHKGGEKDGMAAPLL
jgi:hypothetical protein